jgi:hypothetical protein
MKNKNKEFIKSLYYKYEITWDNGFKDILAPNDAPICWPVQLPVNFAIVSGANPNGKKLSAKQNDKLNKELEIFLDALGISFVEARRMSLGERTLEVDREENSRAFMLMGVTETQAFVIASQFQQRAFVFYNSENTDDLKVELCSSSWDFPAMRSIIYRYETSHDYPNET